ncbi:MAG: SUMF1/EgtB/PvdO family nonheme iron enzyme, partial [Phycisphaerae bacterium]
AAAEGQGDTARQLEVARKFLELRSEALLANPLLDFDKLLLVKRSLTSPKLGLPQNWQGNCALSRSGYDNEIAVVDMKDPGGRLSTLYRPEGTKFVGDVDLHFDADRMMFSSLDSDNRWQVYEIDADGKDLRQVTPGSPAKDVDNYDSVYLPDGRIIFGSTACFHGVPCVGGGNSVANLYLMNADRDPNSIRQLTFEQDHDWCPTITHNGQVMYARWEYSDAPHYFSRLLFSMNPDGTQQLEMYGSNSYWPNSIFYARPCPGHPSKVVAVISGHHGVPRMGELIVFDPAQGRHEASGVVQRIPGYGQKVEPVIRDGLVNGSWPRFLHPWPLSDKYFLVSCQKSNKDTWDLYLVDVFDNMLLLRKEPGYAMFEPIPFRATRRPPIIPDKVDLTRKDAILYVSDVYKGPGLKGVPRGTVKKMRVYSFHYAYYRMGGHINIGIDGPWDVHRILGTVPVDADGSAMFRVPANTPIALQPLDKDGKALQIMRSWMTAMPGEFLSCVGCHEKQSETAVIRYHTATAREPVEITPWYGPARGFSFPREVQPVLDKYCAGCHDGTKKGKDGKPMPDFRRTDKKGQRNFSPAYHALHPYVRRPGPESDYHLSEPLEYHADGSELIQMLRKGHGRVQLDAEAWDRLITWIDLNVPAHGTWSEHRAIASNIHERRLELRTRYAGLSHDPEAIVKGVAGPIEPVQPGAAVEPPAAKVTAPGWPFDSAEAKRRQQAALRRISGQAVEKTEMSVDLVNGVTLDLVLVPAGEFAMGSSQGWPDEWPQARVRIAEPFWMGKFEVTNDQYACFDPTHDSRYISVYNKDQGNRGEPAFREKQPVIRVSWQQAMGFCQAISSKTGMKFSLPTEAQWEYACRAGTETPMNYGAVDADFGKHANLADSRVNNLCRRDSPKWIPSIPEVNDGSVVTDNVGKYTPNAWGLYDMHGNAAEWTRSTHKPYPYNPDDGRDAGNGDGPKVVRGGSFYDRPKRGRSSFRLDYPSWRGVYNVGFRVTCRADAKTVVAAKTEAGK